MKRVGTAFQATGTAYAKAGQLEERGVTRGCITESEGLPGQGLNYSYFLSENKHCFQDKLMMLSSQILSHIIDGEPCCTSELPSAPSRSKLLS